MTAQRLRAVVMGTLIAVTTSVLSATPASTAPRAVTAGDLIASVQLVGSPAIDGTLTAVGNPPVDPNSPDVHYRFVWKDDDVVLTNYSGPSMYLSWLQYGSTISLTVIATLDDGTEQSATSAPVGPISAVGLPSRVGLTSASQAVTVSGTPAIRSTTVATPHGDVLIERAWLRDGVPITATGQTESHTFERADSGHHLSFRLSARQPASGSASSLTSTSSPVVGTITPSLVRLLPATGVKALDNIDIDLTGASRTLYPPVDTTCTWTPTWYRDGQPIPNFPYVYKQVQTTEGGSRIRASLRWTCASTSAVTFAPATTSASNTVTVSGRPYTLSPVNVDRLRDVIVRRSGRQHYQLFYGNRGQGLFRLDYVQQFTAFDGMARVVTGGDLNGDSQGDALAQTSAGDLYLYDIGGSTPRRLWKVGSGWGTMSDVLLAGDVDGNHTGDILARRANDGALVLYSGTGARVLAGRVVATGYRSATKLAVSADATGDAIPDLYATWPDGTLWMYAGKGDGGFKPGVMVGRSGWISMTQLTDGGDANLDGRGDLYAVDNNNRAWAYNGNGNGTLGTRAEMARGWYFTAFR